MREHARRGGSVVLTGDGDDQDQVIVEAVVTAFTPVPGNSFCACGKPVQHGAGAA